MKEIEINFKSECDKNPHLAEIINFSSIVGYKGYSRAVIERMFDQLVPKDNYMKRDREELLQGLFVYSQKKRTRG